MMGWGYGMNGWGVLMMGGLWLILIVAAVAIVVWMFPRDQRPRTAERSPTPLEVLDARLARGEIDVETWRTARGALTEAGQRTA
jgi:putative membrane protein